jgi:hypothetical protein
MHEGKSSLRSEEAGVHSDRQPFNAYWVSG